MIHVAFSNHADMFSCRSKGKDCGVAELTDSNWVTKLTTTPHFVMFYAPWCGHCKMLAPKLKEAGKELQAFGISVGAVDVEPNPKVQSMFSDIRGFPTLKFVKSAQNPSKSAIDYNGPREAADIIRWAKEQASKAGVAVIEPVATKAYNELYTFLGRAALDSKPAMLLLGESIDAPDWFNGLHTALTVDDDTEQDTKRLLEEAKKATKNPAVKDAINDVVALCSSTQHVPLFASAYCPDADTKFSFNATGTTSTLVTLKLDRKNLWKSTYRALGLGKKIQKQELRDWALASLKDDEPGLVVPPFPKPASVLAAEERRVKKLAKIESAADLEAACYSKANCVVAIGVDDNLSALVSKFSKNNMDFVSVHPDSPPATGLLDGLQPPAMVIVKTGKRPRAARVDGGLVDFEHLLDDVLAGQAKFKAFTDKQLPAWVDATDDL